MAPLSSEIKILLEEFAPNFTISKITPGFREDPLHWNDLLTSLDTFVNNYYLFSLIFLNLDLICAFSHYLSLKLGVSSFRDFQVKFVASREKLFSLNISLEFFFINRLNLKSCSLWSGCPRWIIWWYRLLWRSSPRGPCRRTCRRSWLPRLPRSRRISGLRWRHLAAEFVISWVSNGTSNELTKKNCFQLRGGPARYKY